MHHARREAALSSDSDDDTRVDDSGVRALVLTPPRKLLEQVDGRYHTAEHKLDAAASARALQHTPPKRQDHYAKAQRRLAGMVSSDEEEGENARLDAFIARERSTRYSFPAPKDNRARAASPEHKRAQRIARSKSPLARASSPARSPPGRSALLRTLSNTRAGRSVSPARGGQHGDKMVVWVAVGAETEDARASPWAHSAQRLPLPRYAPPRSPPHHH
eukprot:309416-Rhodomonas_salina.1